MVTYKDYEPANTARADTVIERSAEDSTGTSAKTLVKNLKKKAVIK
jgi:hypothetical protein